MPIEGRGKSPEPAEEHSPKNVSVWIKLFVLMHAVAIISWSLPNPPPAVSSGQKKLGIDTRSGRHFVQSAGSFVSDGLLYVNQQYVRSSPLRFYSLSTGFWQYWDMFSPNPANTDYYGSAEITYQDGTVKNVEYPRVYSASIPVKYLRERYRKFYERAHLDSNRYLWPTFGQALALMHYEDAKNPPVKVKLTRHWFPIPGPGEPPRTSYNSYTYYTHIVDLPKLRRDAPEVK